MKKYLFPFLLLIGMATYFWYVLDYRWQDLKAYTPALPAYGKADKVPESPGGSWRLAAPLSSPRTGVSMTAVGSVACVVGGRDKYLRDVATFECYSPKQNSWSAMMPLPKARHHVAAVASEGKLYAFGGFFGFASSPTDNAYSYDFASNTWTELAPIPKSVGAASAVVTGDTIHLFGGRGRTGSSSWHFIYDIKSNAWRGGDDMPTVRQAATAHVLDGKIFVIGGFGDTAISSTGQVDILTINEDIWDPGIQMRTRRGEACSAQIGDVVYVIGGASGSQVLNDIETYSFGRNQWHAQRSLPVGLRGCGAAAIDGLVFVAGGSRRAGFSVTSDVYAYTPESLMLPTAEPKPEPVPESE